MTKSLKESIEEFKELIELVEKLQERIDELDNKHNNTQSLYDLQKFSECMHDNCPTCNGTGKSVLTGGSCVHMVSCPCPKCSPRC